MPDFITLTCPSCGGKLKISEDIDRFACAYCGAEHIVKRGGGIISLIPILDEVKGVRKATDSTAAELAIVRLEKEIERLTEEKESKRGQTYSILFPISLGLGGMLFLASLLILIIGDSFNCLIPFLIGSLVIVTGNYFNEKQIREIVDEINQEITQKQIELSKYKEKVRYY